MPPDGRDAGAEPWTKEFHGVNGIPPCHDCRTAMVRVGGRLGMQVWSDHWRCPACGWELRLAYGRGSV